MSTYIINHNKSDQPSRQEIRSPLSKPYTGKKHHDTTNPRSSSSFIKLPLDEISEGDDNAVRFDIDTEAIAYIKRLHLAAC